ncbi:aldo/keto reductase family-like protein [Leishmania infantum JPCM5]|uniref:Putative aldo/keto reductase n=1 Tax=Leishmania infantum TaxID=5671 RepID=A4I250_LEIIN|nr:aldo/keto reductase family-like protein [Leishmania infantum JPCM5]CAM68837.1 aldo/keto reductase family-like protein [Leishmania infantum JPCM5]|eukprot:XP_001470461.1 aldo/keto reductase family-like protein [Leishmania infantum JPCM5]
MGRGRARGYGRVTAVASRASCTLLPSYQAVWSVCPWRKCPALSIDGSVRCLVTWRRAARVSAALQPPSRPLSQTSARPVMGPPLCLYVSAAQPPLRPVLSAAWFSLIRYTSRWPRCSPLFFSHAGPHRLCHFPLPFLLCTRAGARTRARKSTMATTAVAAAGFLPSLSFGVPPIGIGTYELRGDACVSAVRAALQMGYRLIDTAAAYRNEELVGEGIISSGVPRADLFIVVKIAMKSMGTDEAVRQGILDSIRKLRIDYADCVLMHWPGCGGLKPQDASGHQAARARCWRIMHELQALGKVRYCGVSNFLPRHFKELNCFHDGDGGRSEDEAVAAAAQPHASIKGERNADVAAHRHCSNTSSASSPSSSEAWPASASSHLLSPPILNQIELHPLCIQRDVETYCRRRHGMLLQQYSPLGKGDARLLQHPRLLEVHARYFSNQSDGNHVPAPPQAASPEAVKPYSLEDMILMWGFAQGYCTLVRSHRPDHLRANLDAARDYFASVEAVAKGAGNGGGGGEASQTSAGTARALLTAEQLNVIRHLRAHIGVEGNQDMHLCWYSSQIA